MPARCGPHGYLRHYQGSSISLLLGQEGAISELMTCNCSALEDEILHRKILSDLFSFFLRLACFVSLLACHTGFKLICKSNMYVNLHLLWYACDKGNRSNELILVNMFK